MRFIDFLTVVNVTMKTKGLQATEQQQYENMYSLHNDAVEERL